MQIDYEKIGLKVGLEWHQRLNTSKLFCNCPSKLQTREAEIKLLRKLTLTKSELGEIDPAAEFEKVRNREFIYHVYSDVNCEVEADECPPYELNKEALEIALMISLMLQMEPVDEIHVMRKTVIDGSNTTGFQRTALIALGTERSKINTEQGNVKLETLTLEEESAFIISSSPTKAEYRLDRLGIPLVEVATAADIKTPEHAKEVAQKVGLIFRATHKVQRGLGSIRQDINVSIKEGARQEIKGVQRLELIPKILKNEVRRQLGLIKIRKELRKRGLTMEEISMNYIEVTNIFKNTASKIVRNQIRRGGVALAVKLPKFRNLLSLEIQEGKTFGYELSTYAKKIAGVGGIFHSDELPSYGISVEETEGLLKQLNCREKDAAVLVVDDLKKAKKALEAVVDRAKQALIGVPSETRKPLEDGTTEYLRPLPGPSRMYPETDISPIKLREEYINEIRRKIPSSPDELVKELSRRYSIREETAKQLLIEDKDELFREAVEYSGAEPKTVAFTILNTLKSLKREGIPIKNLKKKEIIETLSLFKKGKISKEAIPLILQKIAETPKLTTEEAVKQLNLKKVSEEDVKKAVEKTVSEKKDLILSFKEKSINKIMGIVMQEFRGKVPGETVYRLVEQEVNKVLKKNRRK